MSGNNFIIFGDKLLDNRCVQCGYCCQRSSCFYGTWDEIKQQCTFLTDELKCEKYDEIIEIEKEDKYPMFNCGCSSSLFNEQRDAKIKEINQSF